MAACVDADEPDVFGRACTWDRCNKALQERAGRSMERILIRNARVITPTGITPGEVLVEDGRIAEINFEGQIPAQARELDACGMYLSPGFIDIHTHGGGGADFMDGDAESIRTACAMHLAHGTTAIVPTTLTGSRESLLDCLKLFGQADFREDGQPEILGLHLEGPYFSYEQRGAQDPTYLRNPEPEEYMRVFECTDRVKRWSFAVELDGGEDFLRALGRQGIVASLAHSDASCAQVKRAYENGLRAMTHFYSGMSGVRRENAYRVAGAIEAGYLLDGLFVEVIADGCHLPAELLQLIYKIKGPEHICLVTDSMRAAGMLDGEYLLGAEESGTLTVVEDGVAKLPDRSAFAGSVATMDRLVRTMKALTDAPLYQVVRMASLTPAELMGVDGTKGSICIGKDADLLLLDERLAVKRVLVRGRDLG